MCIAVVVSSILWVLHWSDDDTDKTKLASLASSGSKGNTMMADDDLREEDTEGRFGLLRHAREPAKWRRGGEGVNKRVSMVSSRGVACHCYWRPARLQAWSPPAARSAPPAAALLGSTAKARRLASACRACEGINWWLPFLLALGSFPFFFFLLLFFSSWKGRASFHWRTMLPAKELWGTTTLLCKTRER